ncbi:InlB B-repeat-containing protein [Bacteroides ovatus]|mgnify:FL=1|uniref:InlB B-repeat-containing protein n=1 Tax=Bacteroides ovatus TaxID=28116 RepID=A0AAW6HD23_BACOV|nr:InlB B-repeat-containing protein [Bacteroides ovatus]MDC2706738.1 InlB B-repeat-containing protein [Bacteroides ovatus]MDC2715734.1 InlB B-repeat-containing protein [Bacteroides ovatus]MDC2742357.1 InlB B-repeat-containing protein [Bacteroides ovatus]
MKQLFSILCLTVLVAIAITSCGDDNDQELQQFTVNFDTQGGSKISSQTVSNGEKVTEPAKPTRDGYAFAGWYTEDSYTHNWDFEEEIVTHDLTLYAKWETAEFMVTFDTKGGSSISAQPVARGAKVERPLPPTKDGFVFDDWYADAALTQVYDFNTLVSGNITLYAKWIEAENITKELLQALINEARAIKESNYTEESFEKMYVKLNAATNIAMNTDSTPQQIQTAYQELKTAISELVELPYRATTQLSVYPKSSNGFIYVNVASENPFYLSASGVDNNGNQSTQNGVTFEYNGLETWASREIAVSENTLSFDINPSLTSGKTISITIKSSEFPSITKIVTLKAIASNELKTLFIDAANALPNPANITMDNYDEVRKAVEAASSLYYSLSTADQEDPAVVAAHEKYETCMYAIENISKFAYSFNGNLCTFTIEGETLYADYVSNGAFPVGTYTMREWDKDGNKYYNYKIVLYTNKTFDTYSRSSNNSNGSNPSEWHKEEDNGTYSYTGSQSTGGYIFMTYTYDEEGYSIRTVQSHFRLKNKVTKRR